MEDEIMYDSNEYFDNDEYADDFALCRQNSYTIIKTSDIEKLRNNIISEVCEFICLSPEETILVLIHYQWNVERIKDQWYDNTDENKQKCGIELTPSVIDILKKRNILPNNKFCYICYSDYNETFFSLSCNHNFCSDCWSQYLLCKLDDLLTSICATCPQDGCSLIVPENTFKKYLSESKKQLYEKAVFKNFTDNNVDMKWCPAPDCKL